MITEYHRPHTVGDAVALVSRSGTVALGGGTSLVADSGGAFEVVDLQDLQLSGIDAEAGTVRIGAMTRLQDIVDSGDVPRVVRDLARREAPRSIRNSATIGGTVAVAAPDSELLTCLLALGAHVTFARADATRDIALDELLEDPGALDHGLVTAVALPTAGRSSADRTGRTPMDRPIVAVVAHELGDDVRVAVSGVAPRPVLVEPDAVGDLEPPSDFRGSSEYRRHLASVLVGRVLAALEADR